MDVKLSQILDGTGGPAVLCAKSLGFCLKSHTRVREGLVGAFLTSLLLKLTSLVS